MMDIFGAQRPASTLVTMAIGDTIVHAWDLSSALGRPYQMPEDLAEMSHGLMQQMVTPEVRGLGNVFGEEVPCSADAPIQDRLVAFSGRQP